MKATCLLIYWIIEVQQMPWDTQYKRLPPAAGSTIASHGGEDTPLADPAAPNWWLQLVCTNTMVKTGRVKDKKHMEHQTDPL